jgi:D-alanyl-D-alanine dipeptidase
MLRSLTALALASVGILACSGTKSNAPAATKAPDANGPTLSDAASSLITVRTSSWDDPHGTLERWHRAARAWEADGAAIPVMIGRSGLAWGRGLHGEGKVAAVDGPEKQEGDGRSPAGAFWLKRALGYAADPPNGAHIPWTQMTPSLQCVEDTKSAYYNQIVDRNSVTPDWSGTDFLRRQDGLYEFIAFVEHNTGPAVPGRGSCILLHVWEGDSTATHGCTSMKREDLATVIGGLAADQNLLVQLPNAVYAELRTAWGLPNAISN